MAKPIRLFQVKKSKKKLLLGMEGGRENTVPTQLARTPRGGSYAPEQG